MRFQWIKIVRISIILFLLTPIMGFSQLISIKTVPIAEGYQFQLFPSKNLGMGGLSIAVDDIWLDPFKNPARGSYLQGTLLFSTPFFYNVTSPGGSAVSLPVTILNHSEDWFGGVSLALQQLTPFSNNNGTPVSTNKKSKTNAYLFGMLGKTLRNGWALGGSLFLSDLNAMEGVDLLYANSRKIDQYGTLMDFRIGLSGSLSQSETLDIVLLHSRLNMTQEIYYQTWRWETATQSIEKNLDKTRTWGVHARYTQSLGNGWRWGGILTANYKSHPKIPNYELMNIPRDPGNSRAFNIGIGTSKTIEQANEKIVYAVDIIYEPIWSDTWAKATDYLVTSNGDIIPPGGKTIENDFKFSNYVIRTGFTRESDQKVFQMGLQARTISYRFQQKDNINLTSRSQRESWIEWNLYWGLTFKYSEFQIRYAGQMGFGTGRPGIESGIFGVRAANTSADYLVAPSGPLTLDREIVLFNQITLSIPLRN